jgi:putative ABC transport system permease protein
VVGRLIRLDGAAHEVIGVMRPSFRYPMNDADAWTTFRWTAAIRADGWFRRAHVVRAIGRLRDGVSPEEASRELAAAMTRLETQFPATNRGNTAGFTPLGDFLVGDRRTPLLLLLGAAGLLLLLVSANVANLSLSRALARRHELAVRSALGASTARLVRLAFAESACLAVGGTVLGLAAAWVGLSVLSVLRPAGLVDVVFDFDWRVFAFAAGVAAASTMIFGLQPALAARRVDVRMGLEGRHGISTGRHALTGAHLLTTLEVALAVVLVVNAGLLFRSIGNMRAVDPGVMMDGVLTMEVRAPAWKYRTNDDRLRLAQRMLERVRGVPGVIEAGVARSIPFQGQGWTSEFTVEGWPADRYGIEVRHRQVTPGYFAALRVPVRAGTVFGEPAGPASPSLVVVNQAFADQWFPGESPLGRRITYSRAPDVDATWHQIVGVVGNERMQLEVDPMPEVIEHLAQDPPQQMHFVVRHGSGPSSVASPLRAAIAAVEPEAPVLAVRTMNDVALEALAADRYGIAIIGVFALVALVVASIGVYGVASQATRLRTHVVCIRVALGAGPLDVLRALTSRGLVFILSGAALGIATTFATGRFVRSQLFRVEATDPLTLATVATILVAVATVALLIPGRRALRTDPVRVLRGE